MFKLPSITKSVFRRDSFLNVRSFSETINSNQLRRQFSDKLAVMFKSEMPEYGQLLSLVNEVNKKALDKNPSLANGVNKSDFLKSLVQERHGAIRLSKPEELTMVRRIMAVMGMQPVDFYPLTESGIPVNATTFRPVKKEDIDASPFRLFTSLVDMGYLYQRDSRKAGVFEAIVGKRDLFSKDLRKILDEMETKNNLSVSLQDEFVEQVVDLFKFKAESNSLVTGLDSNTYKLLAELHPILPDMVLGIHLNHLTPDTLDISTVQHQLESSGSLEAMTMQGPPKTSPVLLNQTSFKAPSVSVSLIDCVLDHKVRFGEVEQRHIALSPKGRDLYDRCLIDVSNLKDKQAIEDIFLKNFPSNNLSLFKEGLGYFTFKLTNKGALTIHSGEGLTDFETLCQYIEDGSITISPIKYEDFLPVSAAGIFNSNGNVVDSEGYANELVRNVEKSRQKLELALGQPTIDPFEGYQYQQDQSFKELQQIFMDPLDFYC